MEKNMKKNIYICVCITESLHCTAEINTTLLINYTSIQFFFLNGRVLLGVRGPFQAQGLNEYA